MANPSYEEKHYRLERWKFGVEVATLLIVGGYTTIAAFQWCAMLAANRQNRSALVDVQRAFVSMKGFSALPPTKDCQTNTPLIQISARWENSGTTPATRVFQHMSEDWRDDAMPGDFDFPDKPGPPGGRDGPFIIGPKVEIGSGSVAVPIEVLRAVQQHAKHLYLWGWTKYRDIFSGSREHVTKFCYDVTGITADFSVAIPDSIILETITCARHNCADQECDDEDAEQRKMAPPPPARPGGRPSEPSSSPGA